MGTNEVKGLQGGASVVGFDLYAETAGNEGVAIVDSSGKVGQSDAFDLTTPEGRQAYLSRLQSLGVRASDLPSFVTNMEQSGVVSGLTANELAELKSLAASVAGMASSGGGSLASSSSGMAGVQARWGEFIAQKNVGSATDVNALVEFVLRESYMETNKDLAFYAQKVRFYNELKKQIRDELTKAREFLATMAGSAAETAVDWSTYQNSNGTTGALAFSDTPVLDENGTPVPAAPTADGSLAANKEGVETYIKNLEEKLNSVGDDAQLANVDLQNMLQKQQQTLQMMSNISKMLHDTALAIIRKIGG
ncbi:MAG: hypothetical protein HY903_16500 [Deltaproteobacteria bacterium]|nr:hypothetical protein [Deltaproteobacteria bacterium]